jgi:uncharacterized protein (TIRG00374 family)
VQRRAWLRVLQFIVTIGLSSVLVTKVNWADVGALTARLRWSAMLAGVGFVALSHAINIARWRYILQAKTVGIRRLVAYYGAGLFSNNFLPTGIGGDGVRVALLSRDVSLAQSTISVGLDRALGLVGLTALLLPAFWYGFPPNLQLFSRFAPILFNLRNTLEITGLLLALLAVLGVLIWRYSPRIRNSIVVRMRQMHQTYLVQWSARNLLRHLALAYLLSVISQSWLVAAHWAVFRSLGLDISFGAAIWLLLIVSFSMLLPISINGLGLQESVYVVVLASYNVPPAIALAIALLMRFLMLSFSCLGGLISLSPGDRKIDAHLSDDQCVMLPEQISKT